MFITTPSLSLSPRNGSVFAPSEKVGGGDSGVMRRYAYEKSLLGTPTPARECSEGAMHSSPGWRLVKADEVGEARLL